MASSDVDQEALRKQLAQVQADYHRLVNSIREAVYVVSSEGIIISLSPVIQTLLGWSPEELAGHNWLSLIHPEDLPLAIERLQRFANGERLPPAKLRLLQRNGEYRALELDSQPDGNGNTVTRIWGLARDSSTDEQLQQLRQDAARERKHIDALMDLIRAVVSRARTPLSGINLRAHGLSRLVTTPAALPAVQSIEQYVQRLTRLIEGLLMLAELDADRVHFSFVPTSLNRLVSYVATYVTPTIHDKNITLTLDLSNNLPLLTVDPNQLHRAILEIVENAIVQTPASGSITIRTYRKDDNAIIDIEDTGSGVLPDLVPHLFERFTQPQLESWVRDQLGLGLPIAEKIVSKHHGRLELAATSPQGSTFRITLPLTGQAV